MTNLTKQERFLIDELCVLAWGASVQRANLYGSDISREHRDVDTFRTGVLAFIEQELLSKYVTAVTEDAHIANIESLVTFGNSLGRALLGPDGYKFGVAQKLLNLQLKYLWCLGHVVEPPHCPVDRIVLNKTALRGRLNWTEITSREQYQTAISAMKSVADAESLSLAQWELQVYERR